MFNHFIKKAFAAIILFITTFFALPVLYARADYRMVYAPKLSERVESIEKLSFVGYTNSLILPASLKTMDIAFLPKIMDPEEGGTLIFTGKEPPVITNDYETTDRISLLVIIPDDADIEAYQNAFDNAGLSENQHVYVKRAGE